MHCFIAERESSRVQLEACRGVSIAIRYRLSESTTRPNEVHDRNNYGSFLSLCRPMPKLRCARNDGFSR